MAIFIKVIHKLVKNTGQWVSSYRLCESYRFDNTIKHTSILHLGRLEDYLMLNKKEPLPGDE